MNKTTIQLEVVEDSEATPEEIRMAEGAMSSLALDIIRAFAIAEAEVLHEVDA